MDLRWIIGWVVDESYKGIKWVTNGSHMSHTLVILLNTTFHIFFSKLTNLWPRHNLATLRIRKMNIIFYQLEESNLVVSYHPFGFLLTWWFICWVGRKKKWEHQHEKRALNRSLRRHTKPLARSCNRPLFNHLLLYSIGLQGDSTSPAKQLSRHCNAYNPRLPTPRCCDLALLNQRFPPECNWWKVTKDCKIVSRFPGRFL